VECSATKCRKGGLNIREFARKRIVLYVLLLTMNFLLFTISCVLAAGASTASTVEDGITRFIKQFYDDREDVYVRFNNLPQALQEKVRVRHIDFAKVPDSKGDGLCLVEIDGKNNRTKTIYVSFRVQGKKKLFLLKQGLKRGEIIRSGDLLAKDTFITEDGGIYPARLEDVVGKAVKKDMAAGTAITCQVLEDSFAVQRGDTVDIVAENKKLSVQAKGVTLERGRLGDRVRVKNLTSDREIVGRVAGNGMVKVEL
jgi:flagella basal body P-ring formation protein FlgA